ncbi:hypothetical protein EVAR_1013_1 [Eumeta japonica]|uniref:Uncharacterized protein n=1 Tax=Eumeta variegata TaxID=151549 RepID=A0A4C1SEL7_EUMVA|nr:hypothetical protein EVAR_1013_1 [Eumeta japonica]
MENEDTTGRMGKKEKPTSYLKLRTAATPATERTPPSSRSTCSTLSTPPCRGETSTTPDNFQSSAVGSQAIKRDGSDYKNPDINTSGDQNRSGPNPGRIGRPDTSRNPLSLQMLYWNHEGITGKKPENLATLLSSKIFMSSCSAKRNCTPNRS